MGRADAQVFARRRDGADFGRSFGILFDLPIYLYQYSLFVAALIFVRLAYLREQSHLHGTVTAVGAPTGTVR